MTDLPMTPRTGRYLFAVARGLDPGTLLGVEGLRGATLEVIDHDGLQAVVCTVDLDEFGEAALRQHLEDLAWLEEVARRHNDVVWVVAASATVAPMRLVTICSDDASVRQRIDDHREGLLRALDNVEGRREWSVKLYADPAGSPARVSSGVPAVADAATGAGAAYLQRKRESLERRRATSDAAATMADAVHTALVQGSVASRRLPPQDPRLTGRKDPMILNGAYLVPDEDTEEFATLIDRLRQSTPGALIEAEGPWPPYSFAVLDEA